MDTHDPSGLYGSTWTRVSAAALTPRPRGRGRGPAFDLPRAWCARSVSSFCVALFCKTSGSTRTVQSRKKKTVARLSESLRFAREMAESTECATSATCNPRGGDGRGGRGYWTVRRRFPSAPRRAACRFAGGGRLDDSAANRRPRSHCLHAPHWIVIFAGVGRRRRRRRPCTLRAAT